MTIEIVKGCLFEGWEKEEYNLLCHQVNTRGVMGSGVALGVKKNFPKAFAEYSDLCVGVSDPSNLLGGIQRVNIEYYTGVEYWYSRDVVNIFGQDAFGYGVRQTNYGALGKAFTALSYGLTQASDEAAQDYDVLGFPYRFGCDRGGADWGIVLEMLEFHFKNHQVKIYKLEG